MGDAMQIAGCAAVVQDGLAHQMHVQRCFKGVAVCAEENPEGGLTWQHLGDLHARLMHEVNGSEGTACVLVDRRVEVGLPRRAGRLCCNRDAHAQCARCSTMCMSYAGASWAT